jgi:uncharacterized protein (DUF2267 family)
MKLTGLEVFDSTIQRTNAWLKELMLELNWSDHRKTYLAFRSVLHTLRDHLSAKDAARLGEQLPMLLRGVYFEHWNPEGKPVLLRSSDQFFLGIAAQLAQDHIDTPNAEKIARAVFRLLDRKMAEGEIENIQHIVPPVLSDLWPPTLRAA